METPVLIYLSTENWGADLWQKKKKVMKGQCQAYEALQLIGQSQFTDKGHRYLNTVLALRKKAVSAAKYHFADLYNLCPAMCL